MEQQIIELLAKSKRIVGLKESTRAALEGRVAKIILAEDADGRLKSQVEDLCFHKNLQLLTVPSKRLLGEACGIDVAAAVVSILKEQA